MPNSQIQAEALVTLTWNRESDILSDYVRKKASQSLRSLGYILLEATPRVELENRGFANLCLTTWLCRHKMQ